ncbi:MAG: PepSY-like domain-containing protein [Muribaculaceae bacterium]|nr:PepSY-like domain-containing protein [Muribaculaceae bacterium]
MKTSTFKFIATLFLVTGFLSFTSCSNDDDGIKETDTTVTQDQLPEKAKEFISEFFYDYEIKSIQKKTIDSVVLYEVEFTNDYDIIFNSLGDWTEMEAPTGMTLPSGAIPEPVRATLDAQYPGYGVNEINTTGQGYYVQLVNDQGENGLGLYFNESGEITDITNAD